jgi:hypothetical protein
MGTGLMKLERCPMCDQPAAKSGRVLHVTGVSIAIFLAAMFGLMLGCGMLWVSVEILRSIGW